MGKWKEDNGKPTWMRGRPTGRGGGGGDDAPRTIYLVASYGGGCGGLPVFGGTGQCVRLSPMIRISVGCLVVDVSQWSADVKGVVLMRESGQPNDAVCMYMMMQYLY